MYNRIESRLKAFLRTCSKTSLNMQFWLLWQPASWPSDLCCYKSECAEKSLFTVCAHPFFLSLKLEDNHSKKCWQHNFISYFFSTLQFKLPNQTGPWHYTEGNNQTTTTTKNSEKEKNHHHHHQLPPTTQEPGLGWKYNVTRSSLGF